MIVGQANTLTFSLVAPSGVTYSSPVVTIEENPWATSSAITDNGNGTYSITITPDRETKRVIKLKVIDQGVTRYHGLVTVSRDDANMKLKTFENGNNSPTGDKSLTYSFTNSADVARNWNMEVVIDPASLTATSSVTGPIVGAVRTNFSPDKLTGYLYCNIDLRMADQTIVTLGFDVLHPLSGVRRHIDHPFHVYRPITATWISTGPVYSGVETTLQFSLKFASGKPVSEVVMKPTTVTGATVDPNLVVVDAANGIYGIKLTPGSANISVNPQYSIGTAQTINSVGAKTFTVAQTATATRMPAYSNTRDIPIILKDANGPITDATITRVSAGVYLPEITGSFAPYDAAQGIYIVPMKYTTRPSSSSATTTAENVTCTFTRGGVSYTVPLSLTLANYPYRVSIDSMGTTLDPVNMTPRYTGSKVATFFSPVVKGITGNTVQSANGTIVNNISTTGKLVWTPGVVIPATKDVCLEIMTNSGLGYATFFYSDPFEITRTPYFKMTPTGWNFGAAHNYVSIAEQDLADYEIMLTDDLDVPLKGVTLDTSKIPSIFSNVIGPRLATPDDWSTVVVPKTDGSDGKYLVKVRAKTYTYTWYIPPFNTTFYFFSTDYPGESKPIAVSARIN